MDRAICFDLDDTLYPYEQYVISGFRAAADRLEADIGVDLYEEFCRLYDDGVRRHTFDRALEAAGYPDRPVDDLVEAFHGRVGPLEPYPGVPEVLERLSERYRLGLITDGRNGRAKLRELEFESTFDAVWISPDRGISKADVTPFVETAAQLGVEPEQTTYVGDHPTIDVERPGEIGMRTVRILRGRYASIPATVRPDVVIPTVRSLPSVC